MRSSWSSTDLSGVRFARAGDLLEQLFFGSDGFWYFQTPGKRKNTHLLNVCECFDFGGFSCNPESTQKPAEKKRWEVSKRTKSKDGKLSSSEIAST